MTSRLRDHVDRRARSSGRTAKEIFTEAGRLAYGGGEEKKRFWRAYSQVVRRSGRTLVDRELLVGLAQVLEDPPEALLWLATLDLWERDGWPVAVPMEHP